MNNSKEYLKKWRSENKPKVDACRKKYRESHREILAAKSRLAYKIRRAKNPEHFRKLSRDGYARRKQKNPQKLREDCARKIYGNDHTEWRKSQLIIQGGRCAFCGVKEIELASQKRWSLLVTDHDHSTGKTRWLLCHYCNLALGAVRENLDTIRTMLKNLEEYKNGTKNNL